MNKYKAVAVVAVSIVVGAVVALGYDRGDIALALISLGGTLAVALGVGQRSQSTPKEND